MPRQQGSGTRAKAARGCIGLAAVFALFAAAPAAGFGAPATAPAQDRAADQPPPAEATPPLAVADPTRFPPLDPSAVAARLAALLDNPDLGPNPGAAVMDADTGELLLAERAREPLIPASSLKIITALAVLDSLGPQQQLPTSVVRNPDGEDRARRRTRHGAGRHAALRRRQDLHRHGQRPVVHPRA